MSKIKIISAHTTNPNTSESDKLPKVLHDVKYKNKRGDEKILRLMAADPIEAIELARKQLEA